MDGENQNGWRMDSDFQTCWAPGWDLESHPKGTSHGSVMEEYWAGYESGSWVKCRRIQNCWPQNLDLKSERVATALSCSTAVFGLLL